MQRQKGSKLWYVIGATAIVLIVLGAMVIHGLRGSSASCVSWARSAPAYDPRREPEGWSRILTVPYEGETLRFGGIHGHYWRWLDRDEGRICGLHYNTDKIHATGVDDGRLLYAVEGYLVRLPIPEEQVPQPEQEAAVLQLLTGDVPLTWLGEPRAAGYVYWHGTYTEQNRASAVGFWLKHTALIAFTFDMGGEPGYPFTHDVKPGVDLQYAPKLNFDRGEPIGAAGPPTDPAHTTHE